MSTQNDISPEELEQIERYLDGSMEKPDLEAFETLMFADSAFAKKVARTKKALATVQTEILRTKLDGFHSEISTQKDNKVQSLNNPKRNRIIAFTAAASVAVLFSLYLFSANNDASGKLYDEYYVADPGLPTVMGGKDNYTFNDAMVDYKQGNYDIAFEKWKSQLPQKPENDTLNYFLGVSQLADGSSKGAIPYLEKTIINDQSAFIPDAYFYLGLAHLKQGNVEDAKSALQKSNLTEAHELLNQLNN